MDRTITLNERIAILAKLQPQKDALIVKKNHITYGELHDTVLRIAGLLKQRGILPGNRVLLSAVSKIEMVAMYLGIRYVGAVAVLVDKNATADSIWAVYEDTEASALITDKPIKEYEASIRLLSQKGLWRDAHTEDAQYAEALQGVDPDAISEIIYTTGTTGKPKGIMLTNDSVYHSMCAVIDGLQLTEQERYLLPLPLNHAYAIDTLRAVLFQGATVVLQNGFLFADDTRWNIEELECSAMSMVPSAIGVLKAQFGDRFSEILGHLRFIKFGAGQFGIALQRELVEALPNTIIYNGWGSSETSTAFLLNVTEKVKDGLDTPSIGKPEQGVEIRFLDEEGQYLEATDANHPGRLAVKSKCIMAGYWNKEELTAETRKNGFILTSDLAYQDEQGYVYLLGRADDIINIGGEKVSPLEIENIAEQYDGIRECACIGVADQGEGFDKIPVLFVSVTGSDFDKTIQGLKNYLNERLERFKIPREYIPIAKLPRNRMKKIDRKQLHKIYESRTAETSLSQEETNPVLQALLTRRSIRSFTDQAVPRETLDLILKAGYYAPTGHNMQTWRFTVLQDVDQIRHLKETIATTAKANKLPFYGFENPNVVIIVSNDTRAISPCEDASAAIENILLAAHALGLGAVWIGALKTLRHQEPIQSLLDDYGIPATHDIYGVVNIGYPSAAGRLLAKKTDVVHYVSGRPE